jgi:hypothetical protein
MVPPPYAAAPRRISYIRFRPRIMLVRIDPSAEPREWGLDDLDVEVLRVRHPLPACARMEVTRPFVVLLGEDVRPVDVAFVKRTAREIGAKVVQLGPLLARDSLGRWLRAALEESQDAAAPPAAISG